MNKQKSYTTVKRILEKHAAIGGDFARGTTTFLGLPFAASAIGEASPEAASVIGLSNLLAPVVGAVHGLASKAPDVDDIKRMDDTANRSFIPGVAASRFLRRRRALRRLLYDKPEMLDLPISEITGQVISPYVSGQIGGLIGGVKGTGAGMGVGLGGNLLGTLAAAMTPRRSLEEQAKLENSTTRAILRHLIPGLAAYDMWKGIGATRNLSDRAPGEIYDELRYVREQREREKNKDK